MPWWGNIHYLLLAQRTRQPLRAPSPGNRPNGNLGKAQEGIFSRIHHVTLGCPVRIECQVGGKEGVYREGHLESTTKLVNG